MALKPKAPIKTPRQGICARMLKYFRPELIEDVLFLVLTLGISFYLMYILFEKTSKFH